MTVKLPLPEPAEEQTPENRRALSRRFILEAREELEGGNRLQAGEKAWGAVAQHLKIIGDDRGWNYGSHRQLESIGWHIMTEFPDYYSPELGDALSDAYHKGRGHSYHDWLNLYEVEEIIEVVEKALPVLEAIGNEAPRYFKINSNSQRRRLVELTGNRELQVGDESPVGFSNRHSSPNNAGN